MSWVRTPGAALSRAPPFPVWICSAQAQGQRQPRRSPASRDSPPWARREGEHRVPPAPLNPSSTPKGHKLFLYPCGLAEQLKAACAVAEPKGRAAERGSPCPAALRGYWGAVGAPGTHRGISGVQTPPSPWQFVPAAGSRQDQHQGMSCSLGTPQTRTPGFVPHRGYPWGRVGGYGRCSPLGVAHSPEGDPAQTLPHAQSNTFPPCPS